MTRLPNRGHLYEWLVLDTLPGDVTPVARGGPRAPFDLLVREPEGVFAWEVKGNELDARGVFTERRRFSVTHRQLAFTARHRERVRVCFFWIAPLEDRFGWRRLPAARVRWKSPASPKYVLPPEDAFPVERDLRPYHAVDAGRRLEARWRALPIVDDPFAEAVSPPGVPSESS